MNYVHNVNVGKIVGSIEIELLPWKERIERAKEVMFKLNEGNLVQREEFELGEKQIDLTVSRIRKVDIKCEDTIVSSVDDLMNYKEGIQIINQLSPLIMNGISLEKN